MFTPFQSIAGNLKAFVGMQVSVSGQLIVGEGHRAFLAASYEGYKRGERLLVADDDLISTHLLAKLPAYGGGDVIYDEEAYVTGTVVQTRGAYTFADLRYCKVVRDNFEILVLPVQIR